MLTYSFHLMRHFRINKWNNAGLIKTSTIIRLQWKSRQPYYSGTRRVRSRRRMMASCWCTPGPCSIWSACGWGGSGTPSGTSHTTTLSKFLCFSLTCDWSISIWISMSVQMCCECQNRFKNVTNVKVASNLVQIQMGYKTDTNYKFKKLRMSWLVQKLECPYKSKLRNQTNNILIYIFKLKCCSMFYNQIGSQVPWRLDDGPWPRQRAGVPAQHHQRRQGGLRYLPVRDAGQAEPSGRNYSGRWAGEHVLFMLFLGIS